MVKKESPLAWIDHLGVTIQNERLARGLSQYELATLAGVRQSAISMYENGERKSNLELLSKIAHGLGLTMSELIRKAEIYKPADKPEQKERRRGRPPKNHLD